MALVNTLKDSAQNFTASWADYGPEISCDDHSKLAIWLHFVINDTANPRVRILLKHTGGGSDEYQPLIYTESASVVTVQPEYFEFGADVTQKAVIAFDLDVVIPFVQVQIQAGTVGATPGHIIDSKYTMR